MLDEYDKTSNLTQSAANSALDYYLSPRNNHILGALDIHPLHDLPTHNEIVKKAVKKILCVYISLENA